MRITLALFSILTLLFSSSSFASNQCNSALAESSFYTGQAGYPLEQVTERFVSYLESLFQDGILRLDMLISLKAIISDSSQSTQFSFGEQAGIVEAVHRDAINEYLSSRQFKPETVLQWIAETIGRSHQEAKSRETITNETQFVDGRIVFHPIRRGSFKTALRYSPYTLIIEPLVSEALSVNKKILDYELEISLLQDFEVLEKPITQGQWHELMDDVPYNSRVWFVESNRAAHEVGDQEWVPGYPVLNVNWWSALVFANKLSEMHGYEPAYDLSEMDIDLVDSGSPLSRMQAFGLLKINAPGGDIYKAEGYRLPTHAEYQYLLSKTKKTELELVDQAKTHFLETSHSSRAPGVRPVGFTDFFELDGNPIYDLVGNNQVWTSDLEGEDGVVLTLGNKPLGKSLNPKLLRNPWIQNPGKYKDSVARVPSHPGSGRAVLAGMVPEVISGQFTYEERVFIKSGGTFPRVSSDSRIGIRLVRSLPDGEFERRMKNKEGEQ